MKIINSVKGLDIKIEGKVSDGFNITMSKDKLHAVDATSGVGMIKCYYASSGRSTQYVHAFNMENSSSVDIGTDRDTATVFVPDFPFSGFLTPEFVTSIAPRMTGYIAAPAVKVNVRMGQDIILMHFGNSMKVQSIDSDNPKLSVSDNDWSCNAELSSAKGRLYIACTTTGGGARPMRMELVRTLFAFQPNPAFAYGAGGMMLRQVLATFGPRSLNLDWPPVTRELKEDFLIAFNPSPLKDQIGFRTFDKTLYAIMNEIDGQSDSPGNSTSNGARGPFVLADGPLTRYQLDLIIDRRFTPDIRSTANLELHS